MINFNLLVEFTKNTIDTNVLSTIIKHTHQLIKEKGVEKIHYNLKTSTLYLPEKLLKNYFSPEELKKFSLDEETLEKIELSKQTPEYETFKQEVISYLRNQKRSIKQSKTFLDMRHDLKESYSLYKEGVISSIDCEYKKVGNTYYASEIGYTIKSLKRKTLVNKHFVVEENLKYCKNKRFIFGITQRLPLSEIIQHIEKDLKDVKLIVGNNISADMEILKFYGIDLNNRKTLDLSIFLKYFSKKPESPDLSLENLTKLIHLEPLRMHNAGNDAHYGVKIFCKFINFFNENNYENIVKEFEKIQNEYETEKQKKSKKKKEIPLPVSASVKKFEILEKEFKKNIPLKKVDEKTFLKNEVVNFFSILLFIRKHFSKEIDFDFQCVAR